MRQFSNLSERAHYCAAPDFGFLTGILTTSSTATTYIQLAPGNLMIGLAGTWTGTVSLLVSPTNDVPWFTLATLTTSQAKTYAIGMKVYAKIDYVTSTTNNLLRWGIGQGY